MRSRLVPAVALLLALVPSAAAGDPPPVCAPPGSLECPAYERYENHKFGFSVDVPAFFTRKPADGDGRGQPFEYGGSARLRAWAMVDNPPMTVEQLYRDWTRRDGLTFATLAMNTWVVRGKTDGGRRLFYSRSILADGIISTVEITYTTDLEDRMEPLLARVGPSLMVIAGEGMRARAH